jgi:Tfp pilus assembly protein PilV
MRRGRRAFTLVETLVAAGLLLLFLAVAATFMVTLLRAFSRGTTRSELQQQSVIALSRMTADLQSSSVASLTLLNPTASAAGQPVAFSLIPIDATTAPEGVVTWKQEVVVYVWQPATGRIVRRVFTNADALGQSARLDPLVPRKISSSLLTTMAATPAAGEEQLAADVVRFEVHNENDGGNFIQPPLWLRIRAEKHGSHDSANEVFELTRTVALRNRESQL